MFSIKPDEVKKRISELDGYESELRGIASEIGSIAGSSVIRTSAYRMVQNSLRFQSQYVRENAVGMGSVRAGLLSAAQEYMTAEGDICARAGSTKYKDRGFLAGGAASGVIFLLNEGAEGGKDEDEESKWKLGDVSINVLKGKRDPDSSKNSDGKSKPVSFMDKLKDKYYDSVEKVNDWKDKHSSKKDWVEKEYAKKGWKDIDKDDEKALKEHKENAKKSAAVDVKVLNYGVSDKASVWSGKAMAGTEDSSHAYAESAFMQGKYNADVYAGSMGLGASAGASFCVFTAEEKAQLGNDNLGVYVQSTQTVGEVSGKAEIKGGLFDKDGKFDPALYGGLSAEALAGEVTVSGGVKVAGTDVSATVGVNYGVGAHANIGYKDGKFSLDIGATLGVGVSAKIDIDISGTVNAVADKAKSFFSNMFGW